MMRLTAHGFLHLDFGRWHLWQETEELATELPRQVQFSIASFGVAMQSCPCGNVREKRSPWTYRMLTLAKVQQLRAELFLCGVPGHGHELLLSRLSWMPCKANGKRGQGFWISRNHFTKVSRNLIFLPLPKQGFDKWQVLGVDADSSVGPPGLSLHLPIIILCPGPVAKKS